MPTQALSVSDIENILLEIHTLEQEIALEKDKCDQSIAFFKQRIADAKSIFDSQTRDAQQNIAILTSKLERYFLDNMPKKAKSLKFAGGSFGYNKAQTKFLLNGNELNSDNKDLISLVGNDFLKSKTYVDWAAFKAILDFDQPNAVFRRDTGELISGLIAKKVFAVKTSGKDRFS